LVSMREDWIADSTASAIAASCDGIGTPISIPLCNPTFRFSPAHWHTILNLSGRNTYSMTLLARDELVEIGHKKMVMKNIHQMTFPFRPIEEIQAHSNENLLQAAVNQKRSLHL
jgi:hypothetical protein